MDDQSLRFTLQPQQQRKPVLGAFMLLLIAVLADWQGSLDLAVPAALTAATLLVIYLLVIKGSYSEFNEHGIHSRRGIFRNQVTWEEVSEVKPDPKSGQLLMVYKHHGKPFKVGAPISGGLSTDPQYQAKVTQILKFARSHIART
jgi:hypothetical protein